MLIRALLILSLLVSCAHAQVIAIFTTNNTTTYFGSTQYDRTEITGSMVLVSGTNRYDYYHEVFMRHCIERGPDCLACGYFEAIPSPRRLDIHLWLQSQLK